MDTDLATLFTRARSLGYDPESVVYELSWQDFLAAILDFLVDENLSVESFSEEELQVLLKAALNDAEDSLDWYSVIRTSVEMNMPDRFKNDIQNMDFEEA